MHVLVDYDNVLEIERLRGATFLIEKVLRLLDFNIVAKYQRVSVRLYGGWLDEKRLSRGAQLLLPQIQASFPRGVVITAAAASHTPIVSAALAQSLLCEPLTTVTHTFRQRSQIGKVRCQTPPFAGCADPKNCALTAFESFLNSKSCPGTGCGVTSASVLYAAEQKLVDTMLVTDMIYLANQTSDDICVVSSDDDLWPGIFSALVLGRRVAHVHTRSGRGTVFPYTPPKGSDYRVLHL